MADPKQRIAILSALFIIATAGITTTYIVLQEIRDQRDFSDLGRQTYCFSCENCLEQIGGKCVACKPEWNCRVNQTVGRMFRRCGQNRPFIDKVITEKIDKSLEKIKEGQEDWFRESPRAFYKPCRFVVHWYAQYDTDVESKQGQWKKIQNYDTHRSSYTVSIGSEDCYRNGSVRIPSSGSYMVYAKATVRCTKQDNQKKSVFLEVRSQEETLMRDVETGVCGIVGDLATIYQSGIFYLSRHTKLSLHIKVPEGVQLSSNNMRYKTHLGIYRIGNMPQARRRR